MQPKRAFTVDTRGQSYTIGTVLIIGMALLATIGGAAAGYAFLDRAQDQAREDRATHAMAELDSEISLIALDNNAQSRSINFERTAKESIKVQSGGTIRVETINQTDGTVEEVVLDRELGVIEYQVKDSDSSVAYQGGGVWRHYGGNNSKMVSPPEIHYRGGTLTMPLVLVNSSQSVNPETDTIQVNHLSSESAFPTGSKSNPIQQGQIKIIVQSKYYQGWGEFFENRIGGEVTINDTDNKASIILEAPGDTKSVTSGLASTQSGSGVTIKGSGGKPSFVDSYNSSAGNYTETQSENGAIKATSDITLRGSATIYGDAIIPPGYTVDSKGGSEVTGNIYHEDVNTGNVDQQIRSEISEAKTTNDNDETGEIVDNKLDNSQDTWTLTAGTYYLENDLVIGNGEKLNIDTSDGPVKIAVNGDTIIKSGDVEVTSTDDNPARIYMKGDALTVKSSDVTVPDDDAPRMWIYAQSGLQAEFTSGTKFIGVVYAPDDTDGSGETIIRSQAAVYGGVVGGQATMRSGGVVHYDQSLTNEQVFEDSDFSPVTYLHISVNEVSINEDE